MRKVGLAVSTLYIIDKAQFIDITFRNGNNSNLKNWAYDFLNLSLRTQTRISQIVESVYLNCALNCTVHPEVEETVSKEVRGSSTSFTLSVSVTMDERKVPTLVSFKGTPGESIKICLASILPKA